MLFLVTDLLGRTNSWWSVSWYFLSIDFQSSQRRWRSVFLWLLKKLIGILLYMHISKTKIFFLRNCLLYHSFTHVTLYVTERRKKITKTFCHSIAFLSAVFILWLNAKPKNFFFFHFYSNKDKDAIMEKKAKIWNYWTMSKRLISNLYYNIVHVHTIYSMFNKIIS